MSNLTLTKRQKIVLSSILVAAGFLGIEIFGIFDLRYFLILGLAGLGLLASLWALWGELTKLKAVMLLILPCLFVFAFGAFYLLIPIRWLTKLPAALILGLAFYLLLLSQNVFNVAAFRTIPLYRAASTVAFVFTIVTTLLFFRVIYALHLPFYWNGLAVGLISLPLIIQLLWTIQMERVTLPIIIYSLVVSLILAEAAIGLSFWPIAPTLLNMWAVALATILYILLGLTTEFFKDKLNRRVTWEYVAVGVIVFGATYLTTSWGS